MKSTLGITIWRSITALFRRAEVVPGSAPAAAANKAATTARIDALMALPIKERSAVTMIGDEGVSGYNPPRPAARDET